MAFLLPEKLGSVPQNQTYLLMSPTYDKNINNNFSDLQVSETKSFRDEKKDEKTS